jgi:hypothetical protein
MWDQIASVGSNLLSGWMNNSAALARQHDAQEFSADQFAKRYQTTVKDLQAAGLNPMLAYSQGGGTPPSSAAASSPGYPELGTTYLQSKMNSAQVAQVNAQTELLNEQAKTEQQKQNQLRADTWHLNQQISESQARMPVHVNTASRIEAETVNLRASLGEIEQRINFLKEQIITEPSKRTINYSTSALNDSIRALNLQRQNLLNAEEYLTRAKIPEALNLMKMHEGAIGANLPYVREAAHLSGEFSNLIPWPWKTRKPTSGSTTIYRDGRGNTTGSTSTTVER